MDIAQRSLWSHQSDDSEGFTTKHSRLSVELNKLSPANKLSDLFSRLYFIVPFLILAALPAVEFIVNGSFELSLPNILIVLASIMCLITWLMEINSDLTNLMPVVITGIASTALSMLMVSKTPELHMHAAASMMIMMIWLTSAPKINLYILGAVTALIVAGVSYLLFTASLSLQNLLTVLVLLVSGVMMGGFTQIHRHMHAKDNEPDALLSDDLTTLIYDAKDEEFFEESHEADLDQDWPLVLEKLSKSLTSVHDVDVLFNKMLLIMHESIPYEAAAIGMLQGRDLKMNQTYGNDDILISDILNWSNEMIGFLAEKKQEVTNSFVYRDENEREKRYYRLDLPILSNDKFVGVVTLLRETEAFDNYSCKLSGSILFHSMVSLRSARLYEEFKKLKNKGKQTTLITREQFMDSSAKTLGKLHEPRSASLLMIEIDNFDKLEERYSKETSLAVYNSIAEVLLSATRDNDVLGRYGNGGYSVLLNDIDLLEAKKQAERIRELIAKTPCKTPVGKITTTVSIGLSSASHSDEDIVSLAQRSGMALYVAKESGKNSVKVKL